MLKKFEVKNYKKFKDSLIFDFTKVGGYKFNTECIMNNHISKSIIYGKNSTGKTCLGDALGDITFVVIGNNLKGIRGNILNADSDEKYAEFTYTFDFNGTEVVYGYKRKADYDLAEEFLNVNNDQIYRINFEEKRFAPMNKLYMIGADTIQLDNYTQLLFQDEIDEENNNFGQVPFIRFILNNTVLLQDSIIKKFENFVSRMRMSSVNAQLGSLINRRYIDLMAEQQLLTDFERFLNEMGISCELTVEKLPDGHYELYFKHKNLIPFFETASSGTKALATFYFRYMMNAKEPSLLYLDEFDAFYHYELAKKMVKFFKEKYRNCQLIMTTHNTNLMNNQLMRPDTLFILSTEGKITPLCDATLRELREGHNLEKMYVAGEFEKYE